MWSGSHFCLTSLWPRTVLTKVNSNNQLLNVKYTCAHISVSHFLFARRWVSINPMDLKLVDSAVCPTVKVDLVAHCLHRHIMADVFRAANNGETIEFISSLFTSNNLTTVEPPPHFFVLSLIHLLIIKLRVHKSSRYPVLQGWNPLSRTPQERSCISHLQALQVGLTGTMAFYKDNDNISSIHEKWLFQQAKRFPLVCKMVATVTHYSVSPQTFRAGNSYYLFIKDKTKLLLGCVPHMWLFFL